MRTTSFRTKTATDLHASLQSLQRQNVWNRCEIFGAARFSTLQHSPETEVKRRAYGSASRGDNLSIRASAHIV
jgi:hypothetical protein